MKPQGGFHHHRELIALTSGAFLAAALSGCGNEKLIDPQAGHVSRPVVQSEITVQKENTFPHKGHPVLSAPRQKPTVRSAPLVHLISPTEQAFFFLEKAAVLPSELIATKTVAPIKPVEPVGPVAVSSSLQCDITDIAAPLHDVVTALEEKSLLYATEPLTDCSGIFHRVVQGLKYRCPGKDFPSVEQYRDSRALARWYHERGQLELIRNAGNSTDLLKPGAVLFFGKNGLAYKDFSVDELLTPRKGISHVGVLVKVHKDEAGRVLHYELFHGYGRKGVTAASVTDWHTGTPSRKGYPPFGNGRQQLVALARL